MENRKIKAILFDMDGVLADTDRSRFELLQILLKEKGIDLPDSDYRKSVGKRTKSFLLEFCGDRLGEAEIEEIADRRKRMFQEHPERYITEQSHVKECVEKLSKAGYVLAVASNAQEKIIRIILEKLGIVDYFKVIIGSDHVTKSKPDPEIYLQTIKIVNFPSEESVAIEDSPTGIISAKSAGCKCIAVAYTHDKEDLAGADTIVENLGEISEKIIQNL